MAGASIEDTEGGRVPVASEVGAAAVRPGASVGWRNVRMPSTGDKTMKKHQTGRS